MRSPRRPGRLRALTVGALAGLLLVGGSSTRAAGALDPGPAGAATAIADGWWNRLQGPQEGEPPDNPVRTVAPPLPAPPTVPADTIVTATALGDVTKVAAVAIEVAVPAGGTVDSLTLRLTEAPGNLANVNSATAKVAACPAVVPWGPAKNASWRDRPEADCTLARADGTRADDGTWTFDLTPLAARWTDPFAPLMQNGVVLTADPAASPVTQVSWLDVASGNVVVEMVAGVVMAPPGDYPAAGLDGGATAAAGEEGTVVDTPVPQEELFPAPDTETAAGFSDPLTFFSTGDPPYFPPAPAAVATPPSAEESPATLAAAPRGAPATPAQQPRPAVGFWEDLPALTAVLVPVALGLALLVGLALGPGGRPRPVWPRAGGLSRALARRAGGDTAV